MEKTLYEKFGIKENASYETIKKAYRRLALKYHPDKNNGDSKYDTIFKNINEIYEVLSNPDKRKAYDEKLKAHRENLSTDSNNDKNRTDSYTSFPTSNKNSSVLWFLSPEQRQFFEFLFGFGILLLIASLGDWLCNSSKISTNYNSPENILVEPHENHISGEITFDTALKLKANDTVPLYRKESNKPHKSKNKKLINPEKIDSDNNSQKQRTGEVNF